MKHTNTLKSFLLSFFLLAGVSAYALTPIIRATLSSQLPEDSGIDFTGGSHFWTHNDGFGDNNLYKMSNSGSIVRTITLTNAVNYDWEDLTHDGGRNFLFIGDFGNNSNTRQNLKIYRISYPTATSPDSVTADIINFSYPDQTSFPSQWLNFDAEAFFHYHGNLYIFSKSDGTAIGYTKMYSVPDAPGTYVATLVDSFYTNDRVTSADISPDRNSVILMANSKIHLFQNFTGDAFFRGQHTSISMTPWTQKEALSFTTDHEAFITDENNGTGNHLYYLDLSQWIPPTVTTTFIQDFFKGNISIGPDPADAFLNVHVTDINSYELTFSVFDLTGKQVMIRRFERENMSLAVNTSLLPSGIYFYRIIADDRLLKTARFIVSH
jgi:hypothetical protein